LGSAIVGFIIGGIIASVVRKLTKHPERLITD
jgi:hypothetical protein